MRIPVLAFACAAALPAAPAWGQQDPNYARNLASACFTCHGTDGRRGGGVPPSLAGQDRGVHRARQEARRDDGHLVSPRTEPVVGEASRGIGEAKRSLRSELWLLHARRPDERFPPRLVDDIDLEEGDRLLRVGGDDRAADG